VAGLESEIAYCFTARKKRLGCPITGWMQPEIPTVPITFVEIGAQSKEFVEDEITQVVPALPAITTRFILLVIPSGLSAFKGNAWKSKPSRSGPNVTS
jgi:hypothetical protein